VDQDNNIEIVTRQEELKWDYLFDPMVILGAGDGSVTTALIDAPLAEPDPIENTWFYAFKPKFVTEHMRRGTKNGIVVMAACYGLANDSMAKAFAGRGFKTYFGVTDFAWDAYSRKCSNELFEALLNEGQNTGEAYYSVHDRDGDPEPPPDSKAQFKRWGSDILAYGCGKKGDLSKYTRGLVSLTWHVVYEYIYPSGHRTYIDNKIAGFGTEYFQPDQPGEWTGNTFTQKMDYTDKIKEQHESLTVTVNDSATMVTYVWYWKTYKQGTLTETVEFEGNDIPVDYTDTNDYRLAFSVDGLETCNHVTNFEYARKSTDSGGTLTVGIPNRPQCSGPPQASRIFIELNTGPK
jgi:hypothetical protein